MSKLLDEAIVRVRRLPETAQDAAAELLLGLMEQPPRSLLTELQLDEVRLAVEEAGRGEFATDQEMAGVWKKFGL